MRISRGAKDRVIFEFLGVILTEYDNCHAVTEAKLISNVIEHPTIMAKAPAPSAALIV